MSFVEFLSAVIDQIGTPGFRYPNRECYIWITDDGKVAELWYDDVNRRAEIHLHKINDANLMAAALPLSAAGAKEAAFSINNYFEKG